MYSYEEQKRPTGFTLLELLIVISIIAILAVILVIALNPAETLKKARDIQRISDLNTLKSAIAIYVTSVSSANLDLDGSDTCGTDVWKSTDANPYDVNGNGWIPIDFTELSSGVPISNLPVDPTNSIDYYYQYDCDGDDSTFELNAILESAAYGPSGEDDKSAKDGGNDDEVYEVGTDPGLNII